MSAAALLGFGWPQPAARAEAPLQPNQIRVTGTVPERRLIVVDSEGMIEQFFSNTDNTVAPTITVGSLSGPAAPFTPHLQAEFDGLMRQIHANHIVSVRANPPDRRLIYPDFARPDPMLTYTVTPTRVRGDAEGAPYQIYSSVLK